MESELKVANVTRGKFYGLKTCLKAVVTIPANTFVCYNLSEMIDFFKDVQPGYRGRLEEKFSLFGAGKTFLLALDNSTAPTYNEAMSDPKWDHRFINYSACGKQKKANVELREEQLVNFGEETLSVRPFYTIETVSAGSEFLWDYCYHRKRKNEDKNEMKYCSCGKNKNECKVLNRSRKYDPQLENVIKHIGINSSGNRRYFVKWEGYDMVNNTWNDETEFFGIGIFNEYEKLRKKQEQLKRSNAIRTIKSGGDQNIENADSSSGEEDDRVNIRSAAPMKIVHVCRQKINDKFDIVCYVKFSNWEIHRLKKQRMQQKCPQLLIQYYESCIQWTGNKLKRPRSDDMECSDLHAAKRAFGTELHSNCIKL